MLRIKCPKHPQYAGKQSPRCACQPCIVIHRVRLMAEVNRLIIVEPKPHEKPYEGTGVARD